MRPLKSDSAGNAEIYYAIRLEDRIGPSSSRRAWEDYRGRLSSDHARRCVQALLKNDILKEALDPLLEMPGMRAGLMISTMHRLIDAKAPEVSVLSVPVDSFLIRARQEARAYLNHTYAMWIGIVRTEEAAKRVESADVQALELRCPRFCTGDADFIANKIERGEIFKNFSETERQNILKAAFNVNFIITSLRTFSQDIHILEACAASMRHFVSPGRLTIRTILKQSYERAQEQVSPNGGGDVLVSSMCSEAIEDLWTFMLQNFDDMAGPGTKKADRLLAGPATEESHQQTVVRSAQQARLLGFQTDEVGHLLSLDAESNENAVKIEPLEARLPQSSLSGSVLSALVVKHCVERLDRRCGRPKHATFQTDRILLTRDNLDADFNLLRTKGPEITSFFVLRCQHYAFFRCTPKSLGLESFSKVTTVSAIDPSPVQAKAAMSRDRSIEGTSARATELD